MSDSGEILWSPPSPRDESTQIARYLRWLQAERGLHFEDYWALHRWSVTDLEGFWGSLWDFFEVRSSAPYERVLASREMPGARWFEGARLNYAEHMLGAATDTASVAVHARSQTRAPLELTFGDLREQVAAARTGLAELGVGPGDRVCGYLPNIPETLVSFLAVVSLGATWAACPPEFGPRSVIDRFAMLEPKLLLAVAGYRYGAKPIDRRAEVAEIRAAIPSLEHCVHVPYPGGPDDELPDTVGWERLLSRSAPMEFEQVPFQHPLWVLFSSGTTGLPKAIVHGHGAMVLEHSKNHALSWDLRPGRPAHVVHDDGVDDVERARLLAAVALLDRDARRQPAVPRSRRPVGAGRGAPPDLHGSEPGASDGVPQGRHRPARARPVLDPPARRGRLAAAARGLRLGLRAVRFRRSALLREWRHRPVHRHRPGQPAAAGLPRRDVGPGARLSTSPRSTSTASPSSASSASS